MAAVFSASIRQEGLSPSIALAAQSGRCLVATLGDQTGVPPIVTAACFAYQDPMHKNWIRREFTVPCQGRNPVKSRAMDQSARSTVARGVSQERPTFGRHSVSESYWENANSSTHAEILDAAIEGFEARKLRIDEQIAEVRQLLNGD
jgi:hypothetical protein